MPSHEDVIRLTREDPRANVAAVALQVASISSPSIRSVEWLMVAPQDSVVIITDQRGNQVRVALSYMGQAPPPAGSEVAI